MNKLEQERENNKILYRELFAEADKTFKEQLNKFKDGISCQKCSSCCKIRYSNLSAEDIYELSKQKEAISLEYIKFFVPYGTDKSFDYAKNNKINLELNNQEALKADKNYVERILSKSKEQLYFYFCRNLDDQNNCSSKEKSSLCKDFPQTFTTILPDSCSFREWQKICAEKIIKEIEPDIREKMSRIMHHRDTFSCNRTGTCCRLACSEFSYEELKQKALKGDNFATQFTGVFIPYENLEAARKIFPDYVDLVLKTLNKEEKTYFYHCPHITDDNVCTIYEKRPDICRDFPDNPLVILHNTCGFCEWKEDVAVASMMLHAMTYIYQFYLEKIADAL